jgi:NAD(P)H dehydrogenase (quinone)
MLLRNAVVLLFLAGLCGPPAHSQSARVLVVYHSQTGNTETLAREAQAGAEQVDGVEATLRKAADLKPEEVRRADGVLVGTPVHWHNLSTDAKRLLDRIAEALEPTKTWGEGKTAGAFCTVGGGSGGQEMARLSILTALIAMRFVVIGSVTAEGYGSLGPCAVTGLKPPGVSADAKAEARRFGERFARLTVRWKSSVPK